MNLNMHCSYKDPSLHFFDVRRLYQCLVDEGLLEAVLGDAAIKEADRLKDGAGACKLFTSKHIFAFQKSAYNTEFEFNVAFHNTYIVPSMSQKQNMFCTFRAETNVAVLLSAFFVPSVSLMLRILFPIFQAETNAAEQSRCR